MGVGPGGFAGAAGFAGAEVAGAGVGAAGVEAVGAEAVGVGAAASLATGAVLSAPAGFDSPSGGGVAGDLMSSGISSRVSLIGWDEKNDNF